MINKRIIFIVGGILLVLTVLGLALSPGSKKQSEDTPATVNNTLRTSNLPSNDTFLDALTTQTIQPYFTRNSVVILSASEPVYDWYVVVMRPSKDPLADQSKAVFAKNDDGTLKLIAGPATSLPMSVVRQYNVPLGVQEQLVVYEDE